MSKTIECIAKGWKWLSGNYWQFVKLAWFDWRLMTPSKFHKVVSLSRRETKTRMHFLQLAFIKFTISQSKDPPHIRNMKCEKSHCGGFHLVSFVDCNRLFFFFLIFCRCFFCLLIRQSHFIDTLILVSVDVAKWFSMLLKKARRSFTVSSSRRTVFNSINSLKKVKKPKYIARFRQLEWFQHTQKVLN